MEMLHLRVIFFGLLLASAFPAGSAAALQSDVAATAQPAPFTTIFLTTSHGAKNPSTSSRYVVWQDRRNGNWDIYAYDLVDGVEFQVTRDPHDQIFPSISGTVVVWEDVVATTPAISTVTILLTRASSWSTPDAVEICAQRSPANTWCG